MSNAQRKTKRRRSDVTESKTALFAAIRGELARIRSSPAEAKQALSSIARLLDVAEKTCTNIRTLADEAEREIGCAATAFMRVDALAYEDANDLRDERATSSLSLGISVEALHVIRRELASIVEPSMEVK